MINSEPGEQFQSGDLVHLRWVDEEDRLNALSTDAVGTVGEHLAVGGFLVSFPEAGIGVFPAERLEHIDETSPGQER
jgi:hypothetical protein